MGGDSSLCNSSINFYYIDASDNSNSSCDSDQLQQSDPNYHGKSDIHQQGGIPIHCNESISISDMEKYATDMEVRNAGSKHLLVTIELDG